MKKTIFAALAVAGLAALPFGTTFAAPSAEALSVLEKAGLSEAAYRDLLKKGTLPVDQKKKPIVPEAVAEALVLAYKDATFDSNGNVKGGDAAKLVRALRKDYSLGVYPDAMVRLLDHETPAVRARAVDTLSGYYSSILGSGRNAYPASAKAAISKLLKEETEPHVVRALLSAYGNDGARNAEVGAFILRVLNAPEPLSRISGIQYACSTWNVKLAGFQEKMIDLLNDADDEVRITALKYVAKLSDDDKWLVEIEKALASTNKKVKAAAAAALVGQWWDFPFHRNANEQAYARTVEILKARPLDQDVVGTQMLLALGIRAEKAYVKWLERSKAWYDNDAFNAILADLAKDEALSPGTKMNVIRTLVKRGYTKEQMTALIEQLKAGNAKPFVISTAERELKNIK